MASALRILALTSELPWPLTSGGHLRTFHLLRSLAGAFGRVTLIAPTPRVDREASSALEAAGVDVRPTLVPPRSWRLEAARGLRALARREPYAFYHRHNHPEIWQALAGVVRETSPEVLYLDHLDSFLYAGIAPNLPRVLDLHNVYSTIVARTADSRGVVAATAARFEATRLAAIERDAVRTVDLTMSVSEDDAAEFRRLDARRVVVVPNGVDTDAYASLPVGRPAGSSPKLVYVGALSWAPNAEAARTLATDVLSAVRRRHPGAEAHIIGRAPTPEVAALASIPGVHVHADVPDVRPHLADAAALVVPLEVGGGTRLKILESFAAGLPVVSTPVGCEGLEVEDGAQLLIADGPHLGEAVTRLLDDPALGAALAARARTLAARVYDWRAVGATATQAIGALVAATGAQSRPSMLR